MCDITHSYVWHDAVIYVTRRIHMCDTTHSYVWHDSFICVKWRNHMCDTTQSYQHVCTHTVRHGNRHLVSSNPVMTRRIHTYDMTHSYVWHDAIISTCMHTHSATRQQAVDVIKSQPPSCLALPSPLFPVSFTYMILVSFTYIQVSFTFNVGLFYTWSRFLLHIIQVSFTYAIQSHMLYNLPSPLLPLSATHTYNSLLHILYKSLLFVIYIFFTQDIGFFYKWTVSFAHDRTASFAHDRTVSFAHDMGLVHTR